MLSLVGTGHAKDPAPAAIPVPGQLQMHGFVSQGYIKSFGNYYLAKYTAEQGSFEFAEAALNATISPTDTLTTSMQLFTRDLGDIGNYGVVFDWFQLDWHPDDKLGLRAGRVRMPYGLYNAVSDYDPGRVSILLPQSIYSTTSRDYLLAVTGGELYGVLDLGSVGHLNYSGYGGAIFPGDESPMATIDIPYTTGGQLMWETPLPGLTLGGSVLAAKLEGDIATVDAKGAPAVLGYEVPAVLWVTSAQYLRGRVVVAAEYSRQHSELESSDQTLFPDTKINAERYYLLTTVETAPWMHVGAYYSASFPDIDFKDDLTRVQHDVAGTLRFDLNAYWLVKLEGHYMHGIADAAEALNADTPIGKRPLDWGVALVKTTAYF